MTVRLSENRISLPEEITLWHMKGNSLFMNLHHQCCRRACKIHEVSLNNVTKKKKMVQIYSSLPGFNIRVSSPSVKKPIHYLLNMQKCREMGRKMKFTSYCNRRIACSIRSKVSWGHFCPQISMCEPNTTTIVGFQAVIMEIKEDTPYIFSFGPECYWFVVVGVYFLIHRSNY